jgi:hypothetical protein
MKLNLKMAGSDEAIVVDVPDCTNPVDLQKFKDDLEFLIKTGHILHYGELTIFPSHVQGFYLTNLPTSTSSSTSSTTTLNPNPQEVTT